MFDIKDKNVLITGATSGIGRAAAIELSSVGANIFFVINNDHDSLISRALGSIVTAFFALKIR